MGCAAWFVLVTPAGWRPALLNASLVACRCRLARRFVQCYSCGNPETVIKIRKRTECIELKCKACGFVRCAARRGGVAAAAPWRHPSVPTRSARLIPCLACLDCARPVWTARFRAWHHAPRHARPCAEALAGAVRCSWQVLRPMPVGPARPLPSCSDVSPKEKLVGYIIKNPPEEKLSKAEKK